MDLTNHSTIVDREFCNLTHPQNQSFLNVKTFGKFQSYPEGICNPAFTRMILWEYCEDVTLDDNKICQFHNIKSGIIINARVAYVFTPIENNDIKSHVKILFRNKKLKNSIPHSKATTIILKYVRAQSLKSLIPCIKQIQIDLNGMLGINNDLYKGDDSSYLTLLHRIYLLTFMLRYKMPLQRKSPPGNRNLSTSRFCSKGKGWYSKLSRVEQKILNDPTITISSDPILEDGISRSELKSSKHISHYDIQNIQKGNIIYI